jgi:hypothetical protein
MNAQLFTITVAVIIILTVLALLRSYVLPEKYAITWIIASLAISVLALFPEVISTISATLGISDPTNLLFFGSLVFILLLLMQLSLEIAKTKDDLRRALQNLAVNKSAEED